MKKIVLIFLVFVNVLSLKAQEVKSDVAINTNAPVFLFETDVMDYGKIVQSSNGVRKFKFRNVGKSDLLISSISSTCGCTVPNYPKEAILPGGTGEIEIKYDTNILGGFSKMITVFSNASEPQKILRLKGIVIKPEENVVLEKKSNVVSQK